MSAPVRQRPPVAAAVIERLKAAVGPQGYLDQPDDVAPYCKSWRGNWVGKSPLFLRPRTTAELAEVVRICADTDTAIVPQGGNTGLTYGSQPGQGMNEVIVSTARMKAIRGIDTDNDSITVEAGVVLQEIQRAAATAPTPTTDSCPRPRSESGRPTRKAICSMPGATASVTPFRVTFTRRRSTPRHAPRTPERVTSSPRPTRWRRWESRTSIPRCRSCASAT